jgi:probable rRNA maturation factor
MTAMIDITIDDEFQGKVKKDWIMDITKSILESEKVTFPYEVGIVITGAETVRKLNRQYRNIDSTTDVLSFCLLEPADGISDIFQLPPNSENQLGDVVISFPQAVEQAAVQGHSVEKELTALLIHGLLHLLGYDHEKDEDKESMENLEKKLLNSLYSETLE